jgi:hypothetical protein
MTAMAASVSSTMSGTPSYRDVSTGVWRTEFEGTGDTGGTVDGAVGLGEDAGDAVASDAKVLVPEIG